MYLENTIQKLLLSHNNEQNKNIKMEKNDVEKLIKFNYKWRYKKQGSP